MTVKQVERGEFYSTLTGHTYDSEMAANHYDNLERQRRKPESPGQKFLDSLSAEDLRSVVMELNASADEATGKVGWEQVQKDFVSSTPEFVANLQNGGAMVALLTERGKLTPTGVFVGTMQDMQEAFCDLVERGVVHVKKGAPAPKRPFDELEAYDLSLDELRQRALGW